MKRDDLLITVGASGIIQPEEVVDIGAQVVGRIKELGIDPRAATDEKFAGKTVDYGSPVTEGMVGWAVGLLLLVLVVRWLGSRAR